MNYIKTLFMGLALIMLSMSSAITQQQPSVRDGFHSIIITPCFPTFDQAAQVAASLDLSPLFAGQGVNIFPIDNTQEVMLQNFVSVYTDSQQDHYVIFFTGPDGVTCILNEGTNFQPM